MEGRERDMDRENESGKIREEMGRNSDVRK